MKNRIHITTQDKQRLEDLLAEAAFSDARNRGDLKSLSEELQRAVIVDPKEIPDDVITMNSRAAMIDLDTRETITLTLVFPRGRHRRRQNFRYSHRSALECWDIALATSLNGLYPTAFAG